MCLKILMLENKKTKHCRLDLLLLETTASSSSVGFNPWKEYALRLLIEFTVFLEEDANVVAMK